MINRITHGEITVEVGDVLYIPDNIQPVTVLALYKTDRVRAVLGYAGQEHLMDGGVVLSRVKEGEWSSVGRPVYLEGQRFRQPSTDTLVTVKGVSDRQVLNGHSTPQFQYFVQHVDANGTISYAILDEIFLHGYEKEISVVVRPFPEETPLDIAVDEIEIIIE